MARCGRRPWPGRSARQDGGLGRATQDVLHARWFEGARRRGAGPRRRTGEGVPCSRLVHAARRVALRRQPERARLLHDRVTSGGREVRGRTQAARCGPGGARGLRRRTHRTPRRGARRQRRQAPVLAGLGGAARCAAYCAPDAGRVHHRAHLLGRAARVRRRCAGYRVAPPERRGGCDARAEHAGSACARAHRLRSRRGHGWLGWLE